MEIIEKIIKDNLCVGCGACVEKGCGTMKYNSEGFLVPSFQEGVNTSKDLEKYCPFNPNPDDSVRDEDVLADEFLTTAENRDLQIGMYNDTYVGYSTEYRKTSSSGGIATYVFEWLLRNNIVDSIFVVIEVDGGYAYRQVSDSSDIKRTSKTRYTPVSLIDFFQKIEQIKGRIAVSGVACFLKAIRLKQHYSPALKEKIPFLVGIICGGLKSTFFTEYLVGHTGIEGKFHNADYRIKDEMKRASDYSFGAFDSSEVFHQVEMKKVGEMWGSGLFKSHACDFCTDVTTELADISLGDAWINPYRNDGLGNSIIITRSQIADEIIRAGISSGELCVEKLSLGKIKLSQKGSFNHRQWAVKYRLRKTKAKGLVPFVRRRMLTRIPFYFKFVQDQRLIVREKSLQVWAKFKNFPEFDEHMREPLMKLSEKTKFYHLIEKIKAKIFKNK